MTIQTKHFIELSDIIALRLDCKNCFASLTCSRGDKIEAKLLRVCPQCNEPWAALPGGSTIELEITKLVSALREAKLTLGESRGIPERWRLFAHVRDKN